MLWLVNIVNDEVKGNVLKELECLTGKCIIGDPTAIVFELLKSTSDMAGLCEVLGISYHKDKGKSQANDTLSLFDQLLASGIRLE